MNKLLNDLKDTSSKLKNIKVSEDNKLKRKMLLFYFLEVGLELLKQGDTKDFENNLLSKVDAFYKANPNYITSDIRKELLTRIRDTQVENFSISSRVMNNFSKNIDTELINRIGVESYDISNKYFNDLNVLINKTPF